VAEWKKEKVVGSKHFLFSGEKKVADQYKKEKVVGSRPLSVVHPCGSEHVNIRLSVQS